LIVDVFGFVRKLHLKAWNTKVVKNPNINDPDFKKFSINNTAIIGFYVPGGFGNAPGVRRPPQCERSV
jgi:hypothetical protein